MEERDFGAEDNLMEITRKSRFALSSENQDQIYLLPSITL